MILKKAFNVKESLVLKNGCGHYRHVATETHLGPAYRRRAAAAAAAASGGRRPVPRHPTFLPQVRPRELRWSCVLSRFPCLGVILGPTLAGRSAPDPLLFGLWCAQGPVGRKFTRVCELSNNSYFGNVCDIVRLRCGGKAGFVWSVARGLSDGCGHLSTATRALGAHAARAEAFPADPRRRHLPARVLPRLLETRGSGDKSSLSRLCPLGSWTNWCLHVRSRFSRESA